MLDTKGIDLNKVFTGISAEKEAKLLRSRKVMPQEPMSLRQRLAKRVASTRWLNNALLADISRYQGYIDWSGLKIQISGLICKCSEGAYYSDPTFATNVQECKNNKIPVAGYHFFRADYYVQFGMNTDDWPVPEKDLQFQRVIKQLQNKQIWGFVLDVEDLQVDYHWVAWAANKFMDRISVWTKKYFGEDFKLIIYTYPGYWMEAKNEFSWMPKYNLWVAQWPLGAGSVKTTWEELPKYYPADSVGVQTLANPKWDIWQWTGDRYQLPFVYADTAKKPTNLDLSFYNGTKADFYKWIGWNVDEPVTPEEPVITPETPSPDYTALAARVSTLENIAKHHNLTE